MEEAITILVLEAATGQVETTSAIIMETTTSATMGILMATMETILATIMATMEIILATIMATMAAMVNGNHHHQISSRDHPIPTKLRSPSGQNRPLQ